MAGWKGNGGGGGGGGAQQRKKKKAAAVAAAAAAAAQAAADAAAGGDSDSDSDGSTNGDDVHPPVIVNILDPPAIKHQLDFEAATSLCEAGEYEEDTRFSNIKIGISVFACSFALLGQFYPVPMPDSRTLLMVCVIMYFVGSTALGMMYFWVEDDCILLTKPTGSGKLAEGLNVRSCLIRFQTDYTLILRPRNSKMGAANEYQQMLQITDYFDTNGLFLRDRFVAVVRDMYAKYNEHLRTSQKTM